MIAALLTAALKAAAWAIDRDWGKRVKFNEQPRKEARYLRLADGFDDLSRIADRRLRKPAIQRAIARQRKSPDRGE